MSGHRKLALVISVALVLVIGAAGIAATRASDDVGSSNGPRRPAPTFDAPLLRESDGQITLASLRGKPVVVNFWATWCVPCRKEMPALQAVYEEMGATVSFLGVNNRDSRRVALAFLRDTGVTYPSAFDPDGEIAAAYSVVGMPTTVFVAADGTIVSKHTGQISVAQLRRGIAEALEAS